MSTEKAKKYLEQFGLDKEIKEFESSSATTYEAANVIGCSPAEIAKSLTFHLNDRVLLIVVSGDKRIDNAKFKAQFGKRGSMLAFDEVEPLIGHKVGGVCPFGINPNVEVYLDNSIKRFEYGYIAGGSDHSLIKIKISKLSEISNSKGWVDVCN